MRDDTFRTRPSYATMRVNGQNTDETLSILAPGRTTNYTRMGALQGLGGNTLTFGDQALCLNGLMPQALGKSPWMTKPPV